MTQFVGNLDEVVKRMTRLSVHEGSDTCCEVGDLTSRTRRLSKLKADTFF